MLEGNNVLDNCHNCDRLLIECGQFDIPGEAVELLLRQGRGRMHVAPGVQRDYLPVKCAWHARRL